MYESCDSQILMRLLEGEAPILKRWFEETYGTFHSQRMRYLYALQAFQARFGAGPVLMVRTPARINIIGEHIDYVSYFRSRVLPFGSREHDTLLLVRPRPDRLISVSTTAPGNEDARFAYPPKPPADWPTYLQKQGVPQPHWSNYIRGAAVHLQHLYPERQLLGADILIDSTILIAGGASSSSALVVTSGMALRLRNGLDFDPAELAEASSHAEWYVGTRGGKMDHATMCFAEQGHALRVTFDPFSTDPVPVPTESCRWVTLYTCPAEKGSVVMSEYNERALIARFVIPRLLSGPLWEEIQTVLQTTDLARIQGVADQVPALLEQIPESMTLQEITGQDPGQAGELRALYPALFEVKGVQTPLKVRDRAAYHLGEIQRVHAACAALAAAASATDKDAEEASLRRLGALLDATHAGLRDLYEVSTPELERVVALARSTEGVYGARVMGGGFGGNVLVLVRQDRIEALLARAEAEYYEPQGRTVSEHAMVSSPGAGACTIPFADLINRQRVTWANDWRGWEESGPQLLASCPAPSRPVQPIIVAAGKGTRARQSGLDVAKPVAPIFGQPVVHYILEQLRQVPVSWQTPIVVVSPLTQAHVKQALQGQDVEYAVQRHALGTADAVWEARERIFGAEGDVLVIWGTQPVIRTQSIHATIQIHQAMDASMTFPTTKRTDPYAPILRDAGGRVVDSLETHQGESEPIPFGEDNVGVFCLKASDLLETLTALHADLYDPATRRYRTSSGELGFPNYMVRRLAQMGHRILALALADPREAQGIKTREHLALVEEYVRQLASEDSEESDG